MKILTLTHEYPPLGGGGGRVAQDLCEGYVRLGHEVRVLTAHLAGLPERETRAGVDVFRLASGRRKMFEADFGVMSHYVWASFWLGWSMIREWKPDVIHVHFAVPAGPVAWALRWLTGTPYVLTAHLGDVPGGVPEKTDRIFRWIFPLTPPIWRDAARVVAVSDYTRSLAKRCYPVEVTVIPNGVDLKALDPGQIRVNQPVRLAFAGRFAPQKNPLQVVRTLATLTDLPWTCVMIGDGLLSPAVKEEIVHLELQDRFEMPGWLDPSEVLDWFGRSDILFMPSLSEGLPVVGVQALACGLALVVGRAGGFVELVEEGSNGHLLDPQDQAGLAQVLRCLISDPERLHAYRQASLAMAAHFELFEVVRAYEKILAEASARH